MALLYGTKPTSYSSVLTGLSKVLYDKRLLEGISKQEAAITVTIESTTYTEDETVRRDRVFKAKLDAWVTAYSIITDFQTNAEIKTSMVTVVEAYASGVGTNAGSLVATPYPVSGTINLGALQNLGKVY